MNRRTDDTTQGDGLSSAADPARRRQRSWEVDVQRARALRGDTLEELTESQREWVWRSLLRGVRLAQATKLAQLPPEATPQALQRIANRYSALMDQRRRERQARLEPPRRDISTKGEQAGQ
jgi:hypothetical protein